MDGSGSCEALQVKEKRQEEEELEEEEDGDEGEVEAEEEVSQLGELQEQAGLPSPQPEVELREAKLESQVAASSSASMLSDKDQCSGLQEGLEMKIQMGDAIKGSYTSTGLVISSKLPRFSDEYTLSIASADPKSVSAGKTVELTKSVTKWFTKDGVLVEGLFWKDVEALLSASLAP